MVNQIAIIIPSYNEEKNNWVRIWKKYYYDNLRNKAYAFYIDKNNIMFNFQSAKKLNTDYIEDFS